MTKPDLDKNFLNNPFAVAYFLIDEFKITVRNEFSKNKLYKVIYVNGTIEGAWMCNNECEEAKRFAYCKKKYVFPKKVRDDLKKISSRKDRIDTDVKAEIRTFFTTVKITSIIKQWVSRDINESIELVDSDGNLIYKYK